MSYFKPFKSFVVVTDDGVDQECPTLEWAKRHKRELLKEMEVASTIYEVTGSEGHDESDATWGDEDSLNDLARTYLRHNFTAKQLEKCTKRYGVTIIKHA